MIQSDYIVIDRSQFFEMLKNNFETLSAIKENFDKTCFVSYPNDGSLKQYDNGIEMKNICGYVERMNL